MSKNRLTFTLMDMGYKKAGPVQIFDERTCYENGEIIPFPVQLAIVTHALMLKDRKHAKFIKPRLTALLMRGPIQHCRARSILTAQLLANR